MAQHLWPRLGTRLLLCLPTEPELQQKVLCCTSRSLGRGEAGAAPAVRGGRRLTPTSQHPPPAEPPAVPAGPGAAVLPHGHGAAELVREQNQGTYDTLECMGGEPGFPQRFGVVGLVPPLPTALCLIQHPAGCRRAVKPSSAFRLLAQIPPSTHTVFPLRTFL